MVDDLSDAPAGELQWGRGFESTETRIMQLASVISSMLQWGRGFESTETWCSTIPSRSHGCSFNGAVDLNPRKPGACR